MFIKIYKSVSVRIALVLALLVGIFTVRPVQATESIIYVKWDANGVSNGSSWTDAYTDLQSALAAASIGDEIWVATATYFPTLDGDRSISFVLSDGVKVYGGFTGTETSRGQRNPALYETILSGDLGIPGNTDDNTYHVVTANGVSNTAVLDGFTIRDGNSMMPYPNDVGGGMYNINSSPTLANLIFRDNAASGGGGMFNSDSYPALTNVTFINNTADIGGGIYNVRSNPSLVDVVFDSNSADSGGGAMRNDQSNPTLNEVIFINNTSNTGGGMNNAESAPVLRNVIFKNNSAWYGGGIWNAFNSNANLEQVTFDGNIAYAYGSGMQNTNGSNAILTNVTFTANPTGSLSTGGVIHNGASDAVLTNVTIASNDGKGIYNTSGSNVTIRNSIIWGNSGGHIVNEGNSYSDVGYSIVENGYSGTGNFDQDPLLQPLANNGGFTQTMAPLVASPAINTGDDTNCPATDQRGIARPQGGRCDIGAYETQYTLANPIHVNWNATGTNDGSSWENAFTDLQSALRVASSGNEIWVTTGTYKPTAGTDRTVSFVLKNGAAIYGGFTGTETSLLQRDYKTNITILSGDIGFADYVNDNSYHVVVGSGTDNTAILDGFTITKGNADGFLDPHAWGGGMYVFIGSPSLANLVFTANTASTGGGLALDNSNSLIQNVTFKNNSATSSGGVLIVAGTPIFRNTTFDGNSAAWGGGGMAISSSDPILENVTFYGNLAPRGAGMYTYGSPMLKNVTFRGNIATDIGGGLYNESSNPTIINSIFWNNTGGEIENFDENIPSVSYSIVQGGYAGTGNIDTDPLLGPLQNNGGFTQTMALLAGSPAIDAGDDANCPAADQRGVTRPQGAACDIGAYEAENLVNTLYVKWDAIGANNGTSWMDAFNDLQSALIAASSGDEIWVAAGTYKPTSGTDRTASFLMKNDVAIYGGFAGTETALTERDYQANITILSGDIGVADDTSDNSYHVVIGSNTNNSAILDGFVITAGNANGHDTDNGGGGGLYCINGRPSLSNLTFNENYAGSGGGIFNDNRYDGNTFSITNVTFKNNSAGFYGGGIYNYQGTLALTDVVMSENAAQVGGGIYNEFAGSVETVNSLFSANSASEAGGSIYNRGGMITVANSTFSENSVIYLGGGIYNSGTATIRNSTYSGNAAGNGGGVYSAGVLTVINSTFSGNSASTNGGGILSFYKLSLYNTIVADSISGDDCVVYVGTTVQGNNNLIEGTGNACNLTNGVNGNIIGSDPNLNSLANNGGFTQTMALGVGSSAINAGDDATCPATDQRGVARPQGAHCDIGAYEYEGPFGDTVPPTVVSVTRADANPTLASQVDFHVTFSEDVTGVDVGDFSLTTSGLSGAAVNAVSGSGSFYTVSVGTGSGVGIIRLDVLDDDSIVDAASNPLGGAGSGNGDFNLGEFYTIPQILTLNLNSVAANDGWILESSEKSNLGGSLNATASIFNVGDDKANRQFVGLLHFDTSSLPDNAVITSVTLQVRKQGITGTDPFTTHGGLVLDIQQPYFGTTAGLLASDFESAPGQFAVSTFDPVPVNNWYNAAVDSAGYAYINPTGTTQFRLRFTLDDNNDRSGDAIMFYSGEAPAVKGTTATNRPQLIIQYYIP